MRGNRELAANEQHSRGSAGASRKSFRDHEWCCGVADTQQLFTGSLFIDPGLVIIESPMPRGKRVSRTIDDTSFGLKQRKALPHEFVLDAVAQLSPVTRSMFGCLAVYVGQKIVFALRDKSESTADNGVWLATSEDHHESLRREFPSMRSIQIFGKKITAWQVLPSDAPDFEQSALQACELVMAGDPRIGKVPKPRRTRAKPGTSVRQGTRMGI